MRSILFNKDREFWMESRKGTKNKIIPSQMDDKSEPQDIANVFAGKYNNLYNSVPSEPNAMNKVYERIDNDLQNASYEDCIVNLDNIKHAVRSLKPDKSNGDVGLWSNNIKYGGIYCVIIYQSSLQLCLCMDTVLITCLLLLLHL